MRNKVRECADQLAGFADAVNRVEETAREISQPKIPSKERGCDGKIVLGRSSKAYMKQADRLSRKRGKAFGVYSCPHCGNTHATTKLTKSGDYSVPLLHISYPGDKNRKTDLTPL